MTYNDWINALYNTVTLASTGVPNSPTGVSSFTDPQWLLEVPRIIEYAERRIYGDLDLLTTRVDQIGALSSGQRNFNLPSAVGNFRVLEELSIVTPSNASVLTGNLNVLVPVTRSFLDMSWPSGSTTFGSSIGTIFGLPVYYAMVDYGVIALGPTPDQGYPVICTGTIWPTPLSSANQMTYLTTALPDLWMAATMVRACLFSRDWGGTQDDPQAGASWEMEYQRLLKLADMEEARAQYRAAGWTAQPARQATTPPRQ